MDELLSAIAALVSLVSPEKVQAIAASVRRTDVSMTQGRLADVVSTPLASAAVQQVVEEWQNAGVGSDELASMLLAACYVYTKATKEQSTELVWTGPTTPFVSARRTEQVMLQVINSAERSLFITSFVAYDVSTIVKALNAANDRGVVISMILELSQDHGGRISFDAIGKMKTLVPEAKLFAWRDKTEAFAGGRVHAKVVVADGKTCFITSANLTGHAMEKNMEAGLLIEGGAVPNVLGEHIRSLISIGTVQAV